MGATNDIRETNIDIVSLDCSECKQKFTEKDKKEGNFDVWWDTSSDVELKENRDYSGWLKMKILIRDITHKQKTAMRLTNDGSLTEQEQKYFDCHDTETCDKCYEKFLTSKIKEWQDNYYCFPCYQQISKDYE